MSYGHWKTETDYFDDEWVIWVLRCVTTAPCQLYLEPDLTEQEKADYEDWLDERQWMDSNIKEI